MTDLESGEVCVGWSEAATSTGARRVQGQHSGSYCVGSPLGLGRWGPIVEGVREPGSRRTVLWLRSLRSDGELPFLRAAAIRTRLRDAGLLRALDYGIDGSRGFVVTDPPPELTLADVLRHGPLEPSTIARIGRGVASTLEQLHGAGLAHGALTPARVALGRDGDPCLLDDGLRDATPAAIEQDLASLADVVRAMATGSLPGVPPMVLPVVFEALLARITDPGPGEPLSAAEVARVFDGWLPAATPSSPPTSETAPFESRSGWWWVFGSMALTLLSLVAVAVGGVGVAQALWSQSHRPPPDAEVPGVVSFRIPAGEQRVVVDGIGMSLDEARATLIFVNSATADGLLEAGIRGPIASRIVDGRPYASLQAFAATRGIGPASVSAAAKAASR